MLTFQQMPCRIFVVFGYKRYIQCVCTPLFVGFYRSTLLQIGVAGAMNRQAIYRDKIIFRSAQACLNDPLSRQHVFQYECAAGGDD